MMQLGSWYRKYLQRKSGINVFHLSFSNLGSQSKTEVRQYLLHWLKTDEVKEA